MENQATVPPTSKAGVPRLGNSSAVRREVSFAEAFRFWIKLGFISFGGPAGQIAIMHKELANFCLWHASPCVAAGQALQIISRSAICGDGR